jgi:hypothetical protein
VATQTPEQDTAEPKAPTAGEKRAAAEQADERAARYSRERLHGPDGPRITGHPVSVIAGALHGVDQDEFTLAQITGRIEAFLAREDTTGRAS